MAMLAGIAIGAVTGTVAMLFVFLVADWFERGCP